MKTFISKYGRWGLSVLFGIGVFVFWFFFYPHALNYQEQYQLFLWTSDYLAERLSVPGGLADWLGEFVVQFYKVAWLGSMLLAVVFLLFHRATFCVMRLRNTESALFLLSFAPALLLHWLMGDPSVLLGYAMALLLAMCAVWLMEGRWRLADMGVVPLVYWAAGPLAWLYAVLRVVKCGWRHSWILLLLLVVQMVAGRFLLTQWPLVMVFAPMQYYRIPLQMPALMWVIPLVVVFCVMESRNSGRLGRWLGGWFGGLLAGGLAVGLGWVGISKGYDRDMYELIWQDCQVRHERWDAIIERAERYQVRTAFSSVCVNLALSQQRQLAERMFEFYQSGTDALIMPRIRDLTSMLPSSEVFWRLGMVNSAQRYMFDTQESILNGKKSGRCTKRIAECMIVNGHYDAARKQLNLLKKTLYYRQWAKETEQLLGNDKRVEAHPLYGRLRKLRYKENYLFSYSEIDKMLGLLFINNQENRMALDYFLGQLLLKGDLGGFQQYLSWAQQYGGYSYMPVGYQDAMKCIQRQGNVTGSPYAAYAKRMMQEGGEP